jgi:hypothetical protein
MKFLDRLRPHSAEGRDGWHNLAAYNGHTYNLDLMQGSRPDKADGTFTELVDKIHARSGIIPAAVGARAMLASQVRFRHEEWSTPVTAARPVERNTMGLRALNSIGRSHLLMQMEQDVSYAGNAFVVRGAGGELVRLDPSKVTFALGSDAYPGWDGDVEKLMPHDFKTLGILYNPNVDRLQEKEGHRVFLPGEYVHFMPEPDPAAPWKGGSWVASLTAEAALEGQIAAHQSKFFERGTVPSLVFLSEGLEDEELSAAGKRVTEAYGGTENAYRNLFLSNVTDVRDVSTDFSKIGFDKLHGSIEIAVAMRSRVPAAILGTRDSLAGSSLNAGNFNSARRLFADGFFTPYCWSLCEAFEVFAPPADRKMVLAPDLSGVMFLQEDALDQAQILQTQMATIRSAVDSGFDPEDTVDRVVKGDLTGLVHTGRASVQLQPMDANDPDGDGTGGVPDDAVDDVEVDEDEDMG